MPIPARLSLLKTRAWAWAWVGSPGLTPVLTSEGVSAGPGAEHPNPGTLNPLPPPPASQEVGRQPPGWSKRPFADAQDPVLLLQGFLWEEGEDLEDEEVEQVWARQRQGGAALLWGNLRMKQSGKRRGEGAEGRGVWVPQAALEVPSMWPRCAQVTRGFGMMSGADQTHAGT